MEKNEFIKSEKVRSKFNELQTNFNCVHSRFPLTIDNYYSILGYEKRPAKYLFDALESKDPELQKQCYRPGLHFYSSNGFLIINPFLRHGTISTEFNNIAKLHLFRILLAMSPLDLHPRVLFRVCTVDENTILRGVIEDCRAGRTFTAGNNYITKGLTSTTSEINSKMISFEIKKDARLTINTIDPMVLGINMNDLMGKLAKYPKENEFILMPGLRFNITSCTLRPAAAVTSHDIYDVGISLSRA